MARKIQILDENLKRWYAPDIDGNREDPEPFQFLISPVSGKIMRELKSTLSLKATRLEQEELMRAAELREEELKELVIKRHVHEIRNYSAIDVTKNEVTVISTGEQFVDCIANAAPSEYVILIDVYEAIVRFSSLNDDAKKKPSLLFDSQCLETGDANPGGAASAAVKISAPKTGLGSNGIVTEPPTLDHSVLTGRQG